jgi:DNA-binding transcriptional regulator YiaG
VKEGNVVMLRPAAPQIECPTCGNPVETRFETRPFIYGVGDESVELYADVPVRWCAHCELEYTDHIAEDARHAAICRYLGVMTPSDVMKVREAHEMTRAEFARLSGLGEASLNRWENGLLIQNTGNDRYLYLLSFSDNIERLRRRETLRLVETPGHPDRSSRFVSLSGSDMDQTRRAAERFALRIESH